ncbi:MAG: transglutaminase family protein [Acidobacteriaceae bacterium]
MLIHLGFDLEFDLLVPVPIVAMLHVHESRRSDLVSAEELRLDPAVPVQTYQDVFGNRCSRLLAPMGTMRMTSDFLIRDSGNPDAVEWNAMEHPVQELPSETLQYLLNSRYCEVDRFSNLAFEIFGNSLRGWGRVQAVCDWVHAKVEFGYHHARSTKTAMDVYTERVGVCRDFQHLAITFCRALNIPARYATGYLPDIGVPLSAAPMDFSAWFEAYLGGRWYTFDARHNRPRIGRVLMAVGRDASDVAITTSFGRADLKRFVVVGEEAQESIPAR